MAYPEDQTQEPGAPQPAQPVPAPAPEAQSANTNAWRSWMQDPQNRASLMQFGISMLQPIGVGQSAAGHFASAVGAGGEAAGRVEAEQMAKQKLASETDLREARANLAESRAGIAGSNLSLQQEMLELKRTLGTSQRATELQKRYQEAKLLDPKLTLPDFLAQNQQAVKIIQSQEGGTMGTGGARSPRDQQALEWANANPNDPRAAQIKQRLGAV